MMRRVLWFLAVCGVVFVAFSLKDRHDRKKRRELWAEATD